jgi:hypothetical protein
MPNLINLTGLTLKPLNSSRLGYQTGQSGAFDHSPIEKLNILALLRGLLFCIAIIIATYALIGAAFYVLYAVDACIIEIRHDGIVRAIMQFQITETDCSTLGEDASVRSAYHRHSGTENIGRGLSA